MKHCMIRTAAAFLFLMSAVPGFAQDTVPDLVGTWMGEKTVYFFEGERHSVDILMITEQSGAHFRGTRSWEHISDDEPLGHAGDDHSHAASEPILGMIGFDNRTRLALLASVLRARACQVRPPSSLRNTACMPR